MKSIGLLLIACLPVTANAICLNPFGCEPKTLEECRGEAAKMPTDTGVQVALQNCEEKFVYEPQRKEAEKKAKIESLKRARFEAALKTGATLSELKAIMGEPRVGARKPCTKFENSKSTPSSCLIYEWGGMMFPINGKEVWMGAYEIEMNRDNGRVWGFIIPNNPM